MDFSPFRLDHSTSEPDLGEQPVIGYPLIAPAILEPLWDGWAVEDLPRMAPGRSSLFSGKFHHDGVPMLFPIFRYRSF
jgi:hypothetical protein